MPKRLIHVGHSPDPDDAFMFYALAKGKLDTGELEFRHVLQDIETLNRCALKGELELTAVSVHGYAYVTDRYALLPCGASMGDRYGPMVVAREPYALGDLAGKTIAVPGTLTTAFLAIRLALEGSGTTAGTSRTGGTPCKGVAAPPPPHYEVIPFDQILDAVESGRADAGLIIHEGQLTYADRGLKLAVDLGRWWHEQTGLPLPLGVNAVRKDLGPELMRRVGRLMHESIRYSLDHRAEALDYALPFGRDLDRARADRFVGMYVNDWTLDLGPRGREAVQTLLERGHEAGIIPHSATLEFVAI